MTAAGGIRDRAAAPPAAARASAILRAARRRGWRLACAESCTGGLVAAALTDLPGSSDMFDCGFVTYSNAAKTRLLGVAAETLAAHGAVSEPVAREMARGALAASMADLAVAITGIAGPGGSEFKPEGRVCFALARRQGRARGETEQRGALPGETKPPAQIWAETVEFGALGRAEVRRCARDHALDLLAAALEPGDNGGD